MKTSFTILVVEDEAIAAMTLRMILIQAGYRECYIVATGEEAVAFVRKQTPALILMDIRLAGKLNGLDAARRIKVTADIPVIFMTGYADESIVQQIAELEPVASFIKPLPFPRLLAAINDVLASPQPE